MPDGESSKLGPSDRASSSDAAGVDLTLVRYTLSLTPTERLAALSNATHALSTVRVIRRAPSE